MNSGIDIKYNFYSDTPAGKDPDSHSPTLRKYHKALWSKLLPNGQQLKLEDTHPKAYLYHKSAIGEFFLSSDAITHSYRNTKKLTHITEGLSRAEVDYFFDLGSTIGAYTLFPGNKIDHKMTINGARGCNPKIYDRFDITLECIRRYYSNMESPLTNVLKRYDDFFALFINFKGYVDFFFFQDLVSSDYSAIKFHLPYKCFTDSPLPKSKEEYLIYKESTEKFITSRVERMEESIKFLTLT